MIPEEDLAIILKANLGSWIARNLITIEHPDMATPLRYVNANDDLTHDGLLYSARGFAIAHPTQGAGTFSNGDLSIDNTDLVISAFARQYSYMKRATLTLRTVSTTDLDRVMVGPFEFVIKQIGLTVRAASIVLGFEDTLRESYPFPTFDEHYAGLFGVET
ncbi:MAG: DUF1833 domain-containing protein [Candidatus Melainabacteria bacterium]|nr:DUF1833 domain-containing protein [Candidatus Melainabacteria bacterium]